MPQKTLPIMSDATGQKIATILENVGIGPNNIADNLTTQDATKALSANMGKVLNDKVEEAITELSEVLDKVYPVGAIYISINNTSPASLFGGSWTQLDAGYALWTATSDAGNTIAAGLPNITGSAGAQTGNESFSFADWTGAFSSDYSRSYAGVVSVSSGYSRWGGFNFNASRSSSIYGNSSTVQPPAYKVYVWRRTA